MRDWNEFLNKWWRLVCVHLLVDTSRWAENLGNMANFAARKKEQGTREVGTPPYLGWLWPSWTFAYDGLAIWTSTFVRDGEVRSRPLLSKRMPGIENGSRWPCNCRPNLEILSTPYSRSSRGLEPIYSQRTWKSPNFWSSSNKLNGFWIIPDRGASVVFLSRSRHQFNRVRS